MKTELTISTAAINEAALAKRREMGKGMGAVIYFSGVVREIEGNAPITAIDYEAHEEMARHQFALIFDAVEKSWPVESVRLVHRLGVVPVNEPSLWVEVTAPHRAEAFDACQFLIDEMKQKVPIWKKPLPA
ncbi:MAG: molybdenum cofactor biosynthesis protein MoaE [Verrucomicrobia bacterium]|jgi:molybdopterin synthase catalytic subunit|nr:molybdenum cofactor biosynthesis protein MoaE [Verrucomicrobiota bacterium]MBT3842677.1 molybdenum cofactor biosynthesis protein MoaE [Verrucomicrobiota bacterium]MBT3913122.1 molybdenum cofactor biosynthesis protein MoaE [Verrucomicrobiota bacterium]MBT4226444.1 molybdenum cofactor biosynthesis protein MoaE [Verrucomicrobiota bacterium]MBT4900511.1 molybdenum cofactor biosynthesis protein MoaE [Verrucomicrobiota bacterium]